MDVHARQAQNARDGKSGALSGTDAGFYSPETSDFGPNNPHGVMSTNDHAQTPKANPENKLGESTSPYLLQHRHNPVNWRIWGEDALAEAKRDNKPILLSVGYAACHWCHVMAHESFEDQNIAALMHRLF